MNVEKVQDGMYILLKTKKDKAAYTASTASFQACLGSQ